MSDQAIALNVGIPLDPEGDANTLPAIWDDHDALSVPEDVIGDPETLNSVGSDSATDDTNPVGDSISCQLAMADGALFFRMNVLFRSVRIAISPCWAADSASIAA